MRLLLDTHVLIWSAGNPEKLSERVRTLLLNTNNSWIVSIASIWEMQIKSQSGKLNLNSPLPDLIKIQQEVNNLQILPLELSYIYALKNLQEIVGSLKAHQ